MAIDFPIILVHKGDSWYLKNTLNTALRAGHHIIIIGDESNRYLSGLSDRIVHKSISKYINEDLCKSFDDIYIHLSVNKYHYEKFCFMRWLLVQALIKEMDLDHLILIDSDVLFFAPLDEITAALDSQSFYTTLKHNPSVFLANDSKLVFNELSQYIIGLYMNRDESLEEYVKKRQARREYSSQSQQFYKQYGTSVHFSDMDMLQEFVEATRGFKGHSKHSINSGISHGLLPGLASKDSPLYFNPNFNGIKKHEFFFNKNDNTLSFAGKRVCSLHMQGRSKIWLPMIDDACSSPYSSKFLIDDDSNFIYFRPPGLQC